jgi:hypothetical protein
MRRKIFSKKNLLDVLMINGGVNVALALLVYLLIAPMFLSPIDLEQFDTLILTLIEHGDFLGLALIQLIPFLAPLGLSMLYMATFTDKITADPDGKRRKRMLRSIIILPVLGTLGWVMGFLSLFLVLQGYNLNLPDDLAQGGQWITAIAALVSLTASIFLLRWYFYQHIFLKPQTHTH